MLVAVLLPVLVGLFLLARERFEARVLGPPGHDAGGEQRSASTDRTGPPSGAAAPGSGGGAAEVHGARHSGDEAGLHRQGPGRPIEGRD